MNDLFHHHGAMDLPGDAMDGPDADGVSAAAPPAQQFVLLPETAIATPTTSAAVAAAETSAAGVVSASTHLTINVTYDSSVTDLRTSDPALYVDYTGAVQTAVQFYEDKITNPIAINIRFGYGEIDGSTIDPGASGESSTYIFPTTYADLYNAVAASDATSAVQRAAVASLPTTDPTDGGTFIIATSEAEALGLDVSGYPISGAVGLDSSTDFSWSQAAVAPNTEDAVGTLEHEISEVMGRMDEGGQDGDYSLLDLFRYTAADGTSTAANGAAAGARDEPFAAGYSDDAPSYFSYNGATVTQLYETPSDVANGADIGDWAPTVPNDSYADDPDDGADVVSPTDLQEMNVLGYDLACYAAGSLIETDRGPVEIEHLRNDDFVVCAGKAPQPIRWLGHRRVDCARHPRPRDVWPVRIAAGAFGAAMPRRDLLLSPDHAVFVGGHLIPIRRLINGGSVDQEECEAITYWHVELPEHAVILAEGLEAESYLDTGNRRAFHEADATDLHPSFERGADEAWALSGCAPRLESGPALEALRVQLAERSAMLGLRCAAETVLPLRAAGLASVVVLPGATVVRLVCEAASPAGERRRLGGAISELRLGGEKLALDDTRLVRGFHPIETESGRSWRWTDGDGVIKLVAADAPRLFEVGIVSLAARAA